MARRINTQSHKAMLLDVLNRAKDNDTIRIYDRYNEDVIDVKRKDIISIQSSKFSDTTTISFVLPFGPNNSIIEYDTYSRRTPVIKSGEVLHNFILDKDVDLILFKE